MIRNLIYHVTPMGNWLWNVNLLKNYINVFNGRKIAAVVQGKGLLDISFVKKQLPDFEIIPVENSLFLRETVTLKPLLQKLSTSNGKQDITLYGHTKGVTHFDNKAVTLWTENCYKLNLEKPDLIESWLKDYPAVGAFKRYGKFPHFPKDSFWHYSGTFYWFRNEDLFKRKWQKIVLTRYGAEAYPSLMFKSSEAKCIYYDDVKDLYNLKYITRLLGMKEEIPSRPIRNNIATRKR